MRWQFGYHSQSCDLTESRTLGSCSQKNLVKVEDAGSGDALCSEDGALLHFRHVDSRIHLVLPTTPVVMLDRAGHTLESFDSFISPTHLLGHELRRDYA